MNSLTGSWSFPIILPTPITFGTGYVTLCALAAIISLSLYLFQDQLSVIQFFWAGSFLLDISISRLPYLCLSYLLACLGLVVPGSVIRICLHPATFSISHAGSIS
ncbi:hypothetical protein C8J56DRAFT_1046504 [Mycena floridula]|nr:hypothetical protein C8J56DRAFT_1046504 [Mycena floridula]